MQNLIQSATSVVDTITQNSYLYMCVNADSYISSIVMFCDVGCFVVTVTGCRVKWKLSSSHLAAITSVALQCVTLGHLLASTA